MYAEAKKSIYRTLEASLIFWAKLSKILEEIGYQRNEYNWCVMNNIIDKKKSHFDPDAVSSVLANIDAEYENIAKMTITRGKVYKYLGMNIDYSSYGKVIFSMID